MTENTPFMDTNEITTNNNMQNTVNIIQNFPQIAESTNSTDDTDDDIYDMDYDQGVSQQFTTESKERFIHPIISLIFKDVSDQEIISILEAYCGCKEIGVDENNQPIYDIVDQTEFIAPILQLFSHCAAYGRIPVVRWLLDNFIPLDTSYNDNSIYFECLRWGQHEVIKMLITHCSFKPNIPVLENLLNREKYDQFLYCMKKSILDDNLNVYRYTLIKYVNEQQYMKAINLLNSIKQQSYSDIVINDEIYSESELDSEPELESSENVLSNAEEMHNYDMTSRHCIIL